MIGQHYRTKFIAHMCGHFCLTPEIEQDFLSKTLHYWLSLCWFSKASIRQCQHISCLWKVLFTRIMPRLKSPLIKQGYMHQQHDTRLLPPSIEHITCSEQHPIGYM